MSSGEVATLVLSAVLLIAWIVVMVRDARSVKSRHAEPHAQDGDDGCIWLIGMLLLVALALGAFVLIVKVAKWAWYL